MRRLDRHLVSVHKMTRQSPEYCAHFQRATSSVLNSLDTDSNSSGSADDLDVVESEGEATDNQLIQEDAVYDDPDEILKEVRSQLVVCVLRVYT